MHQFMVVLVYLFVAFNAASAGEYEDAVAAFEARRFDDAVAALKPLAKAGMPKAQILLAEIHAHGQGRPVDGATALDWALRAAEAGDATAQTIVGGYYLRGLGADIDHAEALYWFTRAAEQGEPTALHNAETLTLHGWGTEPDREAAADFLSRAGALGNADSLFLLGHIQFSNALLTLDIDPALASFSAAAQLGHRGAMATLAMLLDELPEVEHHLVKAAFQYQTAIMAGCTDLGAASDAAMARLTQAEAAYVQSQMEHWQSTHLPAVEQRGEAPGPCFGTANTADATGLALVVQALPAQDL